MFKYLCNKASITTVSFWIIHLNYKPKQGGKGPQRIIFNSGPPVLGSKKIFPFFNLLEHFDE